MNHIAGENRPLRALSALFTFALICLFAVMSILLVVLGAQAYRQVTENASINSEIRTSIGYMQGKLRAQDGLGAVSTEHKDGTYVLTLEQEIDGEQYVTYIYCFQGTLYEMFASPETEFIPDQGEALANLESFDIVETNEGFIVTVIDTEQVRYTQFIAKHSTI